MAGLALFARATGRNYDALRALGAVYVVMLLFNPLLLVNDPGFQFSFMATLGLIIGTPIDLTRIIKINKPFQRVRYELQEIGQPTLKDLLMKKFGMKK